MTSKTTSATALALMLAVLGALGSPTVAHALVCPPCSRAVTICSLNGSCNDVCLLDSELVCRPSTGPCDPAELCALDSHGLPACPADVRSPSSTVCRVAADACDVAETCDGTSAACPANAFARAGTGCPDTDLCTDDTCDGAGTCVHTPLPDADGDGTCDGQDPCTNVGGAQNFLSSPKSKTAFSKVNSQTVPDDDGLTLRVSFDLAPGEHFSDLAPDGNGARVLISATSGARIVDVTLASGTYEGKGSRGWSRAKNGKSWTFQDTTGAPLNGIAKLKISDKTTRKTPPRAGVALTGRKGSYPVLAADLPLAVTVTLGNQADASAGLCGESAYTAADCKLNHAGNQMSCAR